MSYFCIRLSYDDWWAIRATIITVVFDCLSQLFSYSLDPFKFDGLFSLSQIIDENLLLFIITLKKKLLTPIEW